MSNGIALQIVKNVGGKTSGNFKLPVSALYFDPSKDGREDTPDLKEHVNNLAANIREQGFLSDFPIKARPDKVTGKYEIANGRNRYRAMMMIVESKDFGNWDGFAEITPTKPNIPDDEFFFMTLHGNNEFQKPFKPMEEGFYFKKLNDSKSNGGHDYSLDEIAKRIGKSIAYVSSRITLVSMPDNEMKKEIQDYVNSGIMTATVAMEIAKRPEAERKGIWNDLKKKHAEAKVNDSKTLPSGKKSTKKSIQVKDVKKADKKSTHSDHISIRTFKANLEVCRTMYESTKSEVWEKALEVMNATFDGKVIDS